MSNSIFELFKIGIGPSSSHTYGPLIAAKEFITDILKKYEVSQISEIKVHLYGSLALTGKGHHTDKALITGLCRYDVAKVTTEQVENAMDEVLNNSKLILVTGETIPFSIKDIVFHYDKELKFHPNGMEFNVRLSSNKEIKRTFFSVGGGFVVEEGKTKSDNKVDVKYKFSSAAELINICEKENLTIAEVIFANESVRSDPEEVKLKALNLWAVMKSCFQTGISKGGILPGGLNVKRRAPLLYKKLFIKEGAGLREPSEVMDWVTLFALAINEENAAGGRVVTAPTNGAAGIIPATLFYYERFCDGANKEGILRFLFTATAVGSLIKDNASISAAELGCQGEVGAACAMAAGGLTAARGGSIYQIEKAAEMGIEHHLGLTCDPIGGLVQIPCIERNSMASMVAINASRLSLLEDEGHHIVPLDKAIQTMKETGRDMLSNYKETSKAGLAVNVTIPEC